MIQRLWRGLVGPLDARQSFATLATAALAGAAVARTTRRDGSWAPAALTAAVAFDLVGGLVAFNLEPTRERYAATSRRDRLLFAVAHLQPFVVPLTGQGGWAVAARRYLTAVGATAALEYLLPASAPKRLAANALAAAASATDVCTSRGGAQSWLGPVYLMKVVGGHGGVEPA